MAHAYLHYYYNINDMIARVNATNDARKVIEDVVEGELVLPPDAKFKGEIKYAKWSKKFKTLEYFDSENTVTTVACDTSQKAKVIVAKSGVEQEFEIV